MNKILNIDEKNFEEIVENSNGWVVVNFAFSNTFPCEKARNAMKDFGEENTQVVLGEFDITDPPSKNLAIISKYDIRAVPTTVIFHNGKEIAKEMGIKTKSQINEFIKENVKNGNNTNNKKEEKEFIQDVEKLRCHFNSYQTLARETSYEQMAEFLKDFNKHFEDYYHLSFNNAQKNVKPVLHWLIDVFGDSQHLGKTDFDVSRIIMSRPKPLVFIDRCLSNLKSQNHFLRFQNNDFSNLKHNDINLQDSFLIEPNFKNSSIRNLNFSNSLIMSPDFNNDSIFKCSDLQGADFSGSMILSGEFKNCSFRGVNFSNATFIGCSFTDVYFGKSTFLETNMTDVNINNCFFEGATFSKGKYHKIAIKGTEFKKVDLRGSPMKKIVEEKDMVSFMK